MNVSIFLFKFWGWYCIIFFFLMITNQEKLMAVINHFKNDAFLFLISFLAIIIGLTNILLHNIWEFNFKIIITLFGWISLIKGLMLFISSKKALSWSTKINLKTIKFLYLMLLLIGLLLLNEGYDIVSL